MDGHRIARGAALLLVFAAVVAAGCAGGPAGPPAPDTAGRYASPAGGFSVAVPPPTGETRVEERALAGGGTLVTFTDVVGRTSSVETRRVDAATPTVDVLAAQLRDRDGVRLDGIRQGPRGRELRYVAAFGGGVEAASVFRAADRLVRVAVASPVGPGGAEYAVEDAETRLEVLLASIAFDG